MPPASLSIDPTVEEQILLLDRTLVKYMFIGIKIDENPHNKVN
jgi:hypothetical protein